jgi:hypothetical protein
MLRWLGGLPLFVLFIIFSGLAIATTVIVERGMRRLTATGPRESIGQTASTVLQAITVVYAIVIGFVIVDEYGQFQDAEQHLGDKAAAIVIVIENAHALPPDDQQAITEDALSYTELLIAEGLPKLADEGTLDFSTGRSLHRMYQTVQAIEPATRSQRVAYESIVGSLNDIVATRSDLLGDARAAIPASLFWVLVLLGVATMATAAVLDTKHRRSHLVILSMLAIAVGANLALVVGLDYPYRGTIRVSDTALVELLYDPAVR